MNIVFVAYSDLDTNGGIHVFNIANRLCARGHDVTVCVPARPEATLKVGQPRFRTLLHKTAAEQDCGFADGRPADLVHAWTPREVVREATQQIATAARAPYFVHLEDNEAHLLECCAGRPYVSLHRMNVSELDMLVPPHLTHPHRGRAFLAGAAGVSALVDELLVFKPEATPGCVIWPAYDAELEWGAAPDPALRRRLGIGDDEYVIAYTGNAHPANSREVASVYIAVALLNRLGLTTRLVRTGVNHAPLFDREAEREIGKHCVELGFVPRADVPRILALADALVQPGRRGEFNDYRFPSKLPEYFASGRPVLLPDTNVGRHLVDERDCILLRTGHAQEIALALSRLLPDRARCERLGRAARAVAETRFSWQRAADELDAFYAQVLGRESASREHAREAA
jgi:glycosyltransferase involved in cell wall biosynthesis